MNPRLRQAFALEMVTARHAFERGDLDMAFQHLERAHILSQRHTREHVQAHWWMLRVGLLRSDAREVLGQMSRIVAALVFSRIWVPVGNTGGANVSALQPMAVPKDLRQIIDGQP